MSIALTAVVTLIVVLLVLNITVGYKHIESEIASDYRVGDPQFARTMGSMLGPPLAGCNHVQALVNGREIFPAMLSAIEGAERSITFETYIYWSGDIGRTFADALARRARAGVRVLVLLDAFGIGEVDASMLEAMRSAGVQVRRYNAPRWFNLGRLNSRTHRRLFIVDGTVGFTGGAGIADLWTGDAEGPRHWRDNHYRVEGPAVAQLQAAFMDNWLQTAGRVIHGEHYFPPIQPAGEMDAQVFTSAPGGGSRSMQAMFLLSIAAAADTVRLSAAYFIPDDLSVNTFVAALRRGVRVQIILPGPHMDQPLVYYASRSTWGRLLEAGAEIYEYQPTMYHCKVLVVDETWTSVGSTNFDNRSFVLNNEANLNVYDSRFALEQVRIFERDLAQSRRVTFEEWRSRPWNQRLRSRAAALISSQL